MLPMWELTGGLTMLLEGSPSWHELMAVMIIFTVIFAAFYWALNNRIWRIENEPKYYPAVPIIKRRLKK